MAGNLAETLKKAPSVTHHQRTLARTASLGGVGLHSGAAVTVRLVPARVGQGVSFVRVDLPARPCIPVLAGHVTDTALATTLGVPGAKVGTVEHLLAAIAGLGLDNLRIEVDGPEVPIMDGSAAPFVQAMLEAGVRLQEEPKSFLVIKRPVVVTEGEKRAALTPARHLRIDCTIDFEHPLITDQQFSLESVEASFVREVAAARTFGFLRDVERLRTAGLARGGSLENAVVVDDFSILNPEGLRFPDEFVRHKILDALGDISLLGRPVVGALTVFKTGHALNHKLVVQVLSDPANYEVVRGRLPDARASEVERPELHGVLAPTAV